MAIVTLFKNSNGNVNVALPSGRTVAFILGRFFTVDKKLERELQAAVDDNNEFGIYIDVNEPEIDTEYATPVDQMKKRLREELLAELKSQGLLKDAGVYNQTLTPQSMTTSQGVTGQQVRNAAEQALVDQQLEALNAGNGGPNAAVHINSSLTVAEQGTAPAPQTVPVSTSAPTTESESLITPPQPVEEGSQESTPSQEESKLSALEKLKRGIK